MKDIQLLIEQLERDTPSSSVSLKDTGIVVLIDPGHGGLLNSNYTTAPNKMAVYPDFKFYEGVWNRWVAWTFANLLFEMNFNYRILVTESTDISLMERVRRAVNASKFMVPSRKYKFYYHSIHANAFGIENVSGIEVFTSPGQTKSDILATIYYQKLAMLGWNMRPGMADGDPDKEEDFYVLSETPMPAILTETGFYTNREEALKMLDPLIVKRIANLFFNAHVEIIKLNLL